MAAVRDQAKITVNGRPMRIDEGEPLEDSVRTVHSVMLMYAERGGEPVTHNGVRGLKKHMNLTRIVQGLTMDLGENDRKTLARLVSQVFRQTGAAVCLRHADPNRHKDPIWFVAYELPENYIVITGAVRGRSAGAAGRAPTAFDENLFLRPGEKKLRPEEVGENRPAGEVTVTQAATKRRLNLTDEQRAAAAEQAKRVFADSHAERRRIRQELLDNLVEFIVTAPVPMTAPELVQLYNHEYGTDWEHTTIRGCLRELESAGKIGTRKETSEERLVRGGGGKVKATAPKIYGPPEGVPIREKLPKGIKPLKTSEQWAEEKKRERMSLDDRVYRAMDVPNVPNSGHGAPRTPHMIAVAADISDREAQEALDRMVANGRVFHHPTVGYYSPMTRVRKSTIEKYANGGATRDVTTDLLEDLEVEPAAKRAEALPRYVNHPGNEPTEAAPPAEDLASLVAAEVARALAAAQPHPAVMPARMVLADELREVTAERDGLLLENAKLREAIGHLEAALTTLRG